MGSDLYDDTVKGSIETEVESRQQVRGQIMSYAKHVFHYQHRTALSSSSSSTMTRFG